MNQVCKDKYTCIRCGTHKPLASPFISNTVTDSLNSLLMQCLEKCVYICVTVFTLSIRTAQFLTVLIQKLEPMLCLKTAVSHLGLHYSLTPFCPNTYGKYGNSFVFSKYL